MTDVITLINPERITPPHEIRDEAKLRALTAAMRRDGWKGRPLLVMEIGGGIYVGLTGSHRIYASMEAELEAVPCVLASTALFFAEYPDADLTPGYEKMLPWTDDDDKLAVFRALGDVAAAELIASEIDANE